MWRVNIAAYCLMTNHYHLLLQTPEGNISRCMRHLNSVYTLRYNRRHGVDGQLFRGRFQSILVSDNAYLLQLVRYIHKNPGKAGLVKNNKDYQWSSYKGYLSYSQKWQWLYKDFIFSMVTPKKQGRLKPFIKYMEADDSANVVKLFALKRRPSIYGPDSFISKIKELYYFKKKDYEVPDSKTLAPTVKMIIETVCAYYDVTFNDLMKTKRGYFNEPRNYAVYLLRHIRGEELGSIAEMFNIKAYSTVSSIVRRVAKLKQQDKKVRKRLEKIQSIIYKGQS